MLAIYSHSTSHQTIAKFHNSETPPHNRPTEGQIDEAASWSMVSQIGATHNMGQWPRRSANFHNIALKLSPNFWVDIVSVINTTHVVCPRQAASSQIAQLETINRAARAQNYDLQLGNVDCLIGLASAFSLSIRGANAKQRAEHVLAFKPSSLFCHPVYNSLRDN